MRDRPLQQADPVSWNRSADQFGRDPDLIHPDELLHPAERKSPYWHACNNALGRGYAAAVLSHADNFEPAPRPARVTWNAPSAGVKARIVQDAALRATPEGQHILHLMDREDRANWFDSIKARLGRPVTAAETPRAKQNRLAPRAQVVSDSTDASDTSYFERLRGMLGGK